MFIMTKKAISSFCTLAKLSSFLDIKYRPAFVPRPQALTPQMAGRAEMTWQLPTYPHHKFCVAPDHRCLAELERETKGVVDEADETRLSLSLHDIPLSLR